MKNPALLDDLTKEVSKNKRRTKLRSTVARNCKIAGVVVGRLVEVGPSGEPLVTFPAASDKEPLPALSIVSLDANSVGRSAVLMFEEGDPNRPIVIGLVEDSSNRQDAVDLSVDKQRVVINADQEIVLRCGNASITLTRAGKVLIRGAYVLSRSSGANRIKGGSVQIN